MIIFSLKNSNEHLAELPATATANQELFLTDMNWYEKRF